MKIKSNNIRKKKHTKKLIRFFLYLTFFAIFIYISLWGITFWKMESYKIDKKEMFSDLLKEIPA